MNHSNFRFARITPLRYRPLKHSVREVGFEKHREQISHGKLECGKQGAHAHMKKGEWDGASLGLGLCCMAGEAAEDKSNFRNETDII